MLQIAITEKQEKELKYLAYWHASLHYILERYPDDKNSVERARGSIQFAFSELDRLQVPFWLQNAALYWSENWRDYTGNDGALLQAINRRPGYFVTLAK